MAEPFLTKLRMKHINSGLAVLHINYLRRPNACLSGKVYLLDLDNTLHFASQSILPEINRQMTQYLVQSLSLDSLQASALRTQYCKRYGATLLGMMRHHGTNPHDFLRETHKFREPLQKLSSRHGSVPSRLKQLNGVRILLTNAPRAYAVDVLKALGLHRHFHAIVAIEDMVVHRQWRPKPSMWLWAQLRTCLKSDRILLADDILGHLHKAAQHGIQTAWVTNPGAGFGHAAGKGRVRKRLRQFSHINRIRF